MRSSWQFPFKRGWKKTLQRQKIVQSDWSNLGDPDDVMETSLTIHDKQWLNCVSTIYPKCLLDCLVEMGLSAIEWMNEWMNLNTMENAKFVIDKP